MDDVDNMDGVRFCIFVLAFWSVFAARAADTTGVTILKERYELRLTGDGYPASLRVLLAGENAGLAPSMLAGGACFYQDGVVALAPPQTDGSDALVAQGGKAAIRYQFKPGEIDLVLTNKTGQAMQFFCVLNRAVNAVESDDGQIEKGPALRLWPAATWFQGRRKLRITGGDRIWGSNEALGESAAPGTQIWEATLKPLEKRIVVLTPSVAGDEEMAKIEGVAPEAPYCAGVVAQGLSLKPAIDGDLRIFSPREYEVFQRKTAGEGEILLAGEAKPGFDRLEYRLSGTSTAGPLPGEWQALPVNAVDHSFRTAISSPAGGWYALSVRASKAGSQAATAELAHVGVGEVFVIAGGADSTNSGSEKTRPGSGMVSTFSGAEWRLADDPQPGADDTTAGGSPWPAFGDALFEKLKVPIAVAVTGRGGASMQEWRAGSPCFVWLMERIGQLHRSGFRAVLWQQSDWACPAADYREEMSELITASNVSAGWSFPWYVAQGSGAALRDAQGRLWEKRVALEGPDLDSIAGDVRAGAHFNAGGLNSAGKLWAGKVSASLEHQLSK